MVNVRPPENSRGIDQTGKPENILEGNSQILPYFCQAKYKDGSIGMRGREGDFTLYITRGSNTKILYHGNFSF